MKRIDNKLRRDVDIFSSVAKLYSDFYCKIFTPSVTPSEAIGGWRIDRSPRQIFILPDGYFQSVECFYTDVIYFSFIFSHLVSRWKTVPTRSFIDSLIFSDAASIQPLQKKKKKEGHFTPFKV